MYPKGLIYKSGEPLSSKTVFLHAPILVKYLYKLLRFFGAGLVFGSALYAVYCLGPAFKAEVVYSASQVVSKVNPEKQADEIINTADKSKKTEEPSTPEYAEANFTEAQRIVNIQEEASALGVNANFSVVIPKIDAKASIIPNVDPNSYRDYMSALKLGVAHSLGTNFPGEGKLIYLFSHSTNSPWYASRYGAVFYLLSKLEVGDQIIVYFADQKHEYKVSQKVVVNPADTSWLADKGEGETLILQTCTPTGTSLRRLLVIAKPSAKI